MITYEFLREGKLAVIRFSEDIDKKTMTSFLEYLFRRKEAPGITKALIDYRDAILNIDVTEIGDIVKVRLDYSYIVKNVQTVHLVSTSYETAFTILFAQKIPPKIADTSVCSTLGHAIQLLDLDFTEAELEERIQNLAFVY